MEPKGSEWWSGALLRVHLDIKMGKQAMGYETSRRTENIDNLQLRVRQLMNQAEDIYKNQNYQRYQEELFRETSDSI